MDRHKKLRIVVPSVMAGIGLVAALVAVEIYARYYSATGYYTPEIMRKRSLEYEPAVFARHVLAREEKTITDWSGDEFHCRINPHGYRGADFDFAKAPGTIRIVFYGGSSVFDIKSYDNDWPHRVEGALEDLGFPQVEVINAGVPTHATFDAFGRFFAEGHLLDPDYVVLYDAWNDIKLFRSTEPLLRSVRPYDDRFDPRLSYRNAIDRKLCELSQVYVRLRYKYYAWRLNAGDEGKKPEGEYASEFGETGPAQYRVDTEMFTDLARNIGAVPILITEARLVRPDNTPAEKERIAYWYQLLTHEALCRAFERCDDIMRSVAQEKGAYLIDAAAAFADKGGLFADHVHVTPEGSKQLARFVAEQLAPILREHGRAPGASDEGAGGVSSGGR
jgi:hypothetical protein